MAPEVLKECYNEKSDIWSMGVCLYVLIANELPFHGSDKFSTMKRIIG